MKARIAVCGWCVVLVAALIGNRGAAQTGTEGKYEGAKVMSAGDIAYPPNTRTPGMVTLDVSVDGSGAVQKVIAVRDVSPLTNAAVTAVNGWKFAPAIRGGQAVAGVARVNVVFNPFNPGNVSIPNKPLTPPEIPQGSKDAQLFRLPEVTAAIYAVYPANTVASGTVVLEVKVGADGTVGDVKVLQGAGVLVTAATNAVKSWTFTAAGYEGKAVGSHETVAFVFVSPAVGTM